MALGTERVEEDHYGLAVGVLAVLGAVLVAVGFVREDTAAIVVGASTMLFVTPSYAAIRRREDRD